MKTKYFYLLAILGMFMACNNDSDKAAIKIVIDRNTTKNILEGMIDGLKSSNINLKIDESTYNEKGGLVKIKGEVEFPNKGYASFSSEKVGRIIIKQDLHVKDGGFSVKVINRWF